MKLIEDPRTLAERIVNTVCADIYGRSGGDWWFDDMEDDVKRDLAVELTAVVQRELNAAEKQPTLPDA